MTDIFFVAQLLDSLAISALIPSVSDSVPRAPGIYFLFRDDLLCYIGKSHDLSVRPLRWTRHVFDEAIMIPKPGFENRQLVAAEGELIRMLRPKLNRRQTSAEQSPVAQRIARTFPDPKQRVLELLKLPISDLKFNEWPRDPNLILNWSDVSP